VNRLIFTVATASAAVATYLASSDSLPWRIVLLGMLAGVIYKAVNYFVNGC
jgi:hypothetical protein